MNIFLSKNLNLKSDFVQYLFLGCFVKISCEHAFQNNSKQNQVIIQVAIRVDDHQEYECANDKPIDRHFVRC